jgi:hypothetical protein
LTEAVTPIGDIRPKVESRESEKGTIKEKGPRIEVGVAHDGGFQGAGQAAFRNVAEISQPCLEREA